MKGILIRRKPSRHRAGQDAAMQTEGDDTQPDAPDALLSGNRINVPDQPHS
jgi:hypothetical protein